MALTASFTVHNFRITTVNGKTPPPHLATLRIPPAWTDVRVDPASLKLICTGRDAAGRRTAIYHPEWVARTSSSKFERVKALLSEHADIRTQIESDINCQGTEAAIVAYLILETGIRPGSTTDTKAAQQAYGATTLQLRHVKPCANGVRLRFVGKKGVRQSVLVTNPYLVRLMLSRKRDGKFSPPSFPLFRTNAAKLNHYIAGLGSGDYTAKDFRTALGTRLAIELLGNRKRLPKAKSRRKAMANAALDKIAAKLGNTRAICRKSYVSPEVLERYSI